MLSYQNLSIVLLLLFCLYATYTDLRERKIKNFCSYGAIYAGTLCHVISVLSGNSPPLGSIATLLGGFCHCSRHFIGSASLLLEMLNSFGVHRC